MRAEGIKSSGLYDSARRIAVMAVVISCHLGLLVLLLRPIHGDRDRTLITEEDPLVLKLRFIPRLQSTAAHLTPPAPQPVALTPRIHKTPALRASEPPSAERTAHVTTPPSEPRSINAPTPPNLRLNNQASTSDGGFQERLANAQHSPDVHGVPGSDRPIVPGIHLINPRNQGVGAVMRNAQRLFGITDRHCIDSEVWRHLTQEELKERHLSLHDLDQMDDKYDCNRPLGLSF